jgi:hypothetical protein
MNTSTFDYSVRLPFAARAANPERLGSKFLATLDALTRIDSNIFPDWQLPDWDASDWKVGDPPVIKEYPLAAARSCIGEIIERAVNRDDFGHPEPESGYTAIAYTTIDATSRRMAFTVYAWITGGAVRLEAVDPMVQTDPAIVTYPLFKAALLAINAIWPAPWACVQASGAAASGRQ